MSMGIAVALIVLVACTLGGDSLQQVQDIVYQSAVRFIDSQSGSSMLGIDKTDAVFHAALSHSSLNVICDINNFHIFPGFNFDHNGISWKDWNLSQAHFEDFLRGGSGPIHLEGMDEIKIA